ncbi:MAG: ATP-binding protein [Elainellaceae cyanobacterium]
MMDSTRYADRPLILHIRLFGDFCLNNNTTSTTALNSGRSHALLVYLLLHRYGPQSRKHLAFQFWPDATDSQARNNLRTALHRLKQHLPGAEQFIYADAQSIGWRTDAPYTLDVEDFESAVERANAAQQQHDLDSLRRALEHAAQTYKGDILPHFDTTYHDDWLMLERERLRQRALWALETLVDVLAQQHETQGAIAQAQTLLRLDPMYESGYQRLMDLHEQTGDRATALRIYHQCREILQDELGIDPSPDTQRLYHRLLNAEPDAPTPRYNLDEVHSQQIQVPISAPVACPSSLPLIGRDREWSSIRQWLNETGAQSHRVLLLTGEPGIGKTRMLEEIHSTAMATRGTVLRGRAFEAETLRPYGVWIDALRGYLATSDQSLIIPPEISLLLPELASEAHTTMLSDRSRLLDAVVQILSQWCADGAPLMILLDDIQWLDDASSALLHYVSRLMRHLPVTIVCAARAQEWLDNSAVAQVIQALRRDRNIHTISLEPLTRDQTMQLLLQVNADRVLDATLTKQIFIDSGGNPLYALEIAQAQNLNLSALDTLEMLIHDRFNQLSQTAREILPWAAAMGRGFPPSLLAQITQLSPLQSMTVMEELETRGILRPSMTQEGESGYDFSHDVVRKIAYQQISAPRQQMMHLHIAQRLQEHADVQTSWINDVAFHADKGGDHYRAATASLAAAQRSLRLFAYTEADQLAQRGIRHCQSLGDRDRIHLHLACLNVIALTGVSSDRLTQIEPDLHALIQAARHHNLGDDESLGLEILLVLNYSYENVSTVYQYALTTAKTASMNAPSTTARMLANGGCCLAEIKRDLVKAEALLIEAQTLADRMQLSISDISGGLGCIRHYWGEWDESFSLMHQAWQTAQLDQDHWRECIWLKYLIQFELDVGNLEAALSHGQTMIEVASSIGEEGSEAAFAIALQALTRYHLQPQTNESSLDSAIVKLHELDTKRMLAYIQNSAAEVDLKHDQLERAIARAGEAYSAAQAIDDRCEYVLSLSVLARGAIAQGSHQRAAAFIKELQSLDINTLSVRAQTAIERVQTSAGYPSIM